MLEKYKSLIGDYEHSLIDFIYGLNINGVINALSISDDNLIRIYNSLLQCEVYNVCAKIEKKYTDSYYKKKHQKILDITT